MLMSPIVERARGTARLVALAWFVLAMSLALALLVALSTAQASSSCPNELFRTGPGASLPDCRAYEMVSPPQKNGGEVDGGVDPETIPAPEQAALNGQAITYGSQTAFPETDPAAGAVTMQYLSRRSPSGWITQAITPEQDLPGGVYDPNPGSEGLSLFTGFTEDLSHAYLNAYEPSPVLGAPAGYYNPYVRDNENDSYSLLSNVTPPIVPSGPADAQTPGLTTEYAGMSSDASHVIFVADDALMPGALPGTTEYGEHGTRNLYEWSGGHLELVSVLPSDEGGEAVVGQFGSVGETSNHGNWGEGFDHVLSADGSRAYWGDREQGRLFLHELAPGGARTIRISASQRAGGEQPNERRPAHYWAASVDGSEAYFTSCQQLTDDSTASVSGSGNCTVPGNTSTHGEDLYQYDASTGKLTDLTVDPTPGQTANVRSVLGVSEDGSYVYFVAQGSLVAGAPSGEGVFDIYAWHDGEVKLIASTTAGDYFVRPNSQYESEQRFIAKGYDLTKFGRTRVSPSGRYLAFESSASLTGYDNRPARAGDCQQLAALGNAGSGIYENEPGACVEVYEYDYQAGKLVCASCNSAGLPPEGNSFVPFAQHLVVIEEGWQSTTVQQRYLLDDGRVFFESTDALLPQASNAGKANVYEYEPNGVGDCTRQTGCLALISTGTSNDNSLFIDSSANGEDVFFTTRQSLVAADGDEALDLYDARVGGGFAPPIAPPCGGEACRPPVAPAPAIYQAPPSATFVGPGNPLQPQIPATTKPKSKSKSKAKKHKAKPKARRRVARHSTRNTSRGGHR